MLQNEGRQLQDCKCGPHSKVLFRMQRPTPQGTFSSRKVLFPSRQSQTVQKTENSTIAISRKTGYTGRMRQFHQEN